MLFHFVNLFIVLSYKGLKKLKQQVLAEELLLLNKEDVLKMKVIQIYLRLLKSYEEECLRKKELLT